MVSLNTGLNALRQLKIFSCAVALFSGLCLIIGVGADLGLDSLSPVVMALELDQSASRTVLLLIFAACLFLLGSSVLLTNALRRMNASEDS